jgi:hypothetical protein
MPRRLLLRRWRSFSPSTSMKLVALISIFSGTAPFRQEKCCMAGVGAPCGLHATETHHRSRYKSAPFGINVAFRKSAGLLRSTPQSGATRMERLGKAMADTRPATGDEGLPVSFTGLALQRCQMVLQADPHDVRTWPTPSLDATREGLRARRLAASTSDKAEITQLAPTQPSARREALANVSEPIAAPAEKPRNWNDAFSESAIGATFAPAMLMSRACWAGKNAHADTPHTAIASRRGTRRRRRQKGGARR